MTSLLLLFALYAPVYSFTPGSICTLKDHDFMKVAYKQGVVVCRRNVSKKQKQRVFQRYGIIPEQRHNFVIDHRVPLCAGGSNHIDNLWPQAKWEAIVKDKMEDRICAELRLGTASQEDAISQALSWPDGV